MSAPFIWAGLPIFFGAVLWFLREYPRVLVLMGTFLCAVFTLLALTLPIENALQIGRQGILIDSTLNILGRQFVLTEEIKPVLTLLFGFSTFWFLGLTVTPSARKMVPYAMVVLGLLIASLAVQPFLYAALIIESAVLISIPMLTIAAKQSTQGLLRFLIFLSLALPFMLLAGWASNLAEANPANVIFLSRAAVFLALGFAFLLGVFPLFAWMPMLMEETHPYISGFVLSLLSVVVLLLGIRFLDSFGWLRTMVVLPSILRFAGGLMVLTAGVWAGFDRNIFRVPAYVTILHNGLALIAMSLRGSSPLIVFGGLLLPRLIMTAFLCLALAKLNERAGFEKGAFTSHPYVAGAVLFSLFSLSGFPLLAGFESLLILIERLGQQSLPILGLTALGILGLLAAGMRHLINMALPEKTTSENAPSKLADSIFIFGGILCLIMGLFPSKIMSVAEVFVRSFQNWQ